MPYSSATRNRRAMRSMSEYFGRLEIRITAVYGIIGLLWILFSDSLLSRIIVEGDTLFLAGSMAKGGGFVGVTALALFLILSSEERKRHAAELASQRDNFERNLAVEKRIEAERREAELRKDRELIELKQRFIAMAAHEFRTPLTAILLASHLLEDYSDKITPELRLRKLHEIQANADRMTELLEDVLKLSKSWLNTLDITLLDLEELCRDIVIQLQPADTTTRKVTFHAEEEFHSIHADKGLVAHILTNLLSNALKYSPCGGEVRLELRQEENELVFRIHDEGIGIPDEDQERLFEPFHRAKNAHGIPGTGLGLAIVKECVDKYGGTIAVDSLESRGTTFTVRLPIFNAPS
jgi:signal transduction histidine kinase